MHTLQDGLIAEGAATAQRHAGPCSICQRAILYGHRYAVTVPEGRFAHLLCLGMMAAPRRPVPAIR